MLNFLKILLVVLFLPSFLQANDLRIMKSDSIAVQIDSSAHAHFLLKFWKPIVLAQDDSSEVELMPTRKKHFWRAGAEWFLAQAFPATFNRFITVDPYSFISFQNFIDHQRLSA